LYVNFVFCNLIEFINSREEGRQAGRQAGRKGG